MDGSDFLRYHLSIDQLAVIRPVTGAEGVHLSIACYVPNTSSHDCRIESATQGDPHPAVGLDLLSQCFNEAVSQGAHVLALVFVGDLYGDVPEPGGMDAFHVDLNPRTRRHGVDSGEAG